MSQISLKNIFQFAIDVEEDGNNFYKSVASSIDKDELVDLFNYLGNQEAEHAKKFLNLYQKYSKEKNIINADKNLEDMLDVISRNMTFPDISEVRDLLKKDQGLIKIIKLAMDVEINTILLYQNMQNKTLEEDRDIFDHIITEEQGHLIKLKNKRLDIDPFYAGIKYGKFF